MDVESALGLICIGFLGEARMFGAWAGLEHPHDRGRSPFPSIFNTDEMRVLMTTYGLKYFRVDQCMFGALTRKPTGLVLPHDSADIVKICNHKVAHESLTGFNPITGEFRTTQAAKYPSGFSEHLAFLFVRRLEHAHNHGYSTPCAPRKIDAVHVHDDPWFGTGRTAWKWPAPSRTFLAECIERCHQGKVSTGLGAPQS